jgi:hypothetical protein
MALPYIQLHSDSLFSNEQTKFGMICTPRPSDSEFRPRSDLTIFEEDGFEPIIEEEEEHDYDFYPYSAQSSNQSSETTWAMSSSSPTESLRSFKSTSTTIASDNATVVGSVYSDLKENVPSMDHSNPDLQDGVIIIHLSTPDLNEAVTSINISNPDLYAGGTSTNYSSLSLDFDIDFDFSGLDFDLTLPKLTFSLPEPIPSRSETSLSKSNPAFSSSTTSLGSHKTRCPSNCAVCSFSSPEQVGRPKASKRNSLRQHLDPKYLRNTYCPFEKARQRRDRRVAMERYQKEFGVVPWTRDAEDQARPSTAF